MSYEGIFRKEPRICLNCATAIPYGRVLLRKSESGNGIIQCCPICRGDQVIIINRLLEESETVRDYLKTCEIRR